MVENCTIRTRIRLCCRLRLTCPCRARSCMAASRARSAFCCTVDTSLTDSASIRVTSWKRV